MRNSASDHLEMVLVNPGLHPVLRALVPLLLRVPMPGPRLGQNSLLGLALPRFFRRCLL